MESSGLNRTYLLIIIGAIAVAAAFCLLTMQLALGVIIAVTAGLCLLIWYYFRCRQPETLIEKGEGDAVLAAGLITLVATANMEWIVWGIGLAFIFMIHQSLARIENRMDALERQTSPGDKR